MKPAYPTSKLFVSIQHSLVQQAPFSRKVSLSPSPQTHFEKQTENSSTIRHCETGKPFHLGGSRKAGEEFQGIAIVPPGIPVHTALKRCLPEKPCLSVANASCTALLYHNLFWKTKAPQSSNSIFCSNRMIQPSTRHTHLFPLLGLTKGSCMGKETDVPALPATA